MPAPAPHSDAMIRRLESEIEERNSLIQGLAQDAQSANNGAGRDLSESEREQITRARDRITVLVEQLEPLRESSRIALEARQRTEVINAEIERMRGRGTLPGEMEYRSVGEYIVDLYAAGLSDRDAQGRLEVFHRAAAHQTTSDNPGLLPQRVIEPVINGVDAARPLVSAIGPQDLGPGSWAYPRVTQHTSVTAQSAEKAELASQKMLVTLETITAPTYGGYVNVSRQNIRRSQPGILDMIIADLAGQYAIATEDAVGDDLVTAATPGTVDLPNAAGLAGAGGAYGVAAAVWGAAGQAAAALRTANVPATGPILAVSPDMLGVVGPLLGLTNQSGGAGAGFSAANAAVQGPQGNIQGLTVVMGAGLATGTVLFFYRSAVRVFEDRYGALTVDEPSVWGLQVGYAGDFETVIVDDGGIIAIDQAA